MVKPAELDKEYFVVVIPGGEIKQRVERIQETIASHYGLYEDMSKPELHITIDRIKKSAIKPAIGFLDSIIDNWSEKVNIALKNFSCLQRRNQKFLVLKIRPTKSLIKLGRNIHHGLDNLNISTINNYEEWRYHITIVNNNFVDKPIQEMDFSNLCDYIEGQENMLISQASRLEIWQPTLENKVIYSRDLLNANNIE
ncbi:MAG: 2'-5' RNA ligase family protein, partial [Bacillota bacterium]